MRCLLALAVGLAPLAAAPAADPLAAAARDAVAARRVQESDLKGARDLGTPYRELAADGGVLVGLEVGLGGSPPAERVLAVRPVYRADGRTWTGPPAGSFLADDVTRTARLLARDGYAVAAVRVSAGRWVDGLGLRFARVTGAWLKAADAYESDWVGPAGADAREWLDGEGRPVVGLFARLDGGAVRGLGVTFAELPKPPDPPAPTPAGPRAAAAPRPLALEAQAPRPAPPRSGTGTWVYVGAALGLIVVLAAVAGSIALRRRRGTDGTYDVPPLLVVHRPAGAPAPPLTGNARPGRIPGPAARPALTDILELESDGWR